MAVVESIPEKNQSPSAQKGGDEILIDQNHTDTLGDITGNETNDEEGNNEEGN